MRAPAWARLRRDTLLPGAVLALGQVNVWTADPGAFHGPRPAIGLVAAACSVALVWRARRPLTVTVAVVLVAAAPTLVWGANQLFAFVLPLGVAVFAGGRYARRPRGYLAVVLGVAGVLLQEWLDPRQTVADGWGWSLWIPAVFVVGVWAAQQRELAERRAEAVAEHARTVAAEDRLRLARELHDVLTHGISVMVVQAEAAEEVLVRDPDRAARAMRAVQQAGRAALGETRRLVTTLRMPHEPAAAGPAPDLTALPELLAAVRAAGLPVSLEVVDDECAVTGSHADSRSRQVAYRVVQEALTNVLRHAGASATRIRLQHEAEALRIEVDNDGAPVAEPRFGHGLSGMQERVRQCGGILQAGPREGGGFRLCVTLPYDAMPASPEQGSLTMAEQ